LFGLGLGWVVYHIALFHSKEIQQSRNQNIAEIILPKNGGVIFRFFIFELANGLKARGIPPANNAEKSKKTVRIFGQVLIFSNIQKRGK
jgi:hypothetical protein